MKLSIILFLTYFLVIWNICDNKTLEEELQNINDNSDDEIHLEDHERFDRSADPEPRGFRVRFSRTRSRSPTYYGSGNSSGGMEGWTIVLIVIGAVVGLIILVVGVKYCCTGS